MDAQDFFYLSAGVGMFIITAVIVYSAFILIKTLKSIEAALKGYREIKNDIDEMGDTVREGALTMISKFLSLFTKGGDNQLQ